MASPVQNQQWRALSEQLANVIEGASKSIVAVRGGGHLGASGIHWRSGLVITANHMIRRDEQLSIILPDGSSASATLAGRDSSTDLALLRIEETAAIASAQTTSTAGLQVGHLVVAVGRSRLGDLAAASGIIARLGGAWRTWRGGEIDQLLRPDITLYRGQSGSALLNAQGQILGMNTAALARMAAITVPASTVDRVIAELLEHGHITRPYLGLAMQIVDVPENIREKMKLQSTTGLLVMHVEADGPGGQAGVMLGDVIVGIEGKAAGDISLLQEALARLRTGQQAKLTILRGGEQRDLAVTLGDRPSRK
jgi:S1-C subfamily serine protease